MYDIMFSNRTKGGEDMVVCKQKVELIMADNCVTYDSLSKKSGLSRITIQKMLAGKVDTRPATVGKIAKALGVNAKELLKDTAATVNQSNLGSESN